LFAATPNVIVDGILDITILTADPSLPRKIESADPWRNLTILALSQLFGPAWYEKYILP
jgi:hypothetical protein